MKRGLKLVLLGVSMFMTGLLGVAILVGSAMITKISINGSSYYKGILRFFEVTPVVNAFLVLGIAGILIAAVGIILKDSK